MRISDWSSDVCSSDLARPQPWCAPQPPRPRRAAGRRTRIRGPRDAVACVRVAQRDALRAGIGDSGTGIWKGGGTIPNPQSPIPKPPTPNPQPPIPQPPPQQPNPQSPHINSHNHTPTNTPLNTRTQI